MTLRYYRNNQALVPKSLRHLSDAELGRETYVVEHKDVGTKFCASPRDEKLQRNADFEHMRSRVRGEEVQL